MASQTITLTGGWQSLGAGPLKLQPKSAGGAWIVAAASQPSGTSGDYYLFPAQVQNFETSDTYWALPDRTGSLIGVEQISLTGGGAVSQAGSVGVDYSANKPTLPNVGANFAASGPYASYVLIATVAASPSRNNIDIENTSGAQIAIIRDDGTAASAAAPVNASVFSLGGGTGAGAQGGSWTSQTFKGRVQVYAASSAAQVAIFVD